MQQEVVDQGIQVQTLDHIQDVLIKEQSYQVKRAWKGEPSGRGRVGEEGAVESGIRSPDPVDGAKATDRNAISRCKR